MLIDLRGCSLLSMSASTPPTFDDALRKIGRNLILFQQAEHAIKDLLAIGNLHASGNHQPDRGELLGVWNKQTMGQLLKVFVERHCTNQEPAANFSNNQRETSFTVSFTLGHTSHEASQRLCALEAPVQERNDFVHHLLTRLPGEGASFQDFCDHLDRQHEAIKLEISRLIEDSTRIRSMLLATVDFATSPAGIEALGFRDSQP